MNQRHRDRGGLPCLRKHPKAQGRVLVWVGVCFLDDKCLFGRAFFTRKAMAVLCLTWRTERTAYKVYLQWFTHCSVLPLNTTPVFITGKWHEHLLYLVKIFLYLACFPEAVNSHPITLFVCSFMHNLNQYVIWNGCQKDQCRTPHASGHQISALELLGWHRSSGGCLLDWVKILIQAEITS